MIARWRRPTLPTEIDHTHLNQVVLTFHEFAVQVFQERNLQMSTRPNSRLNNDDTQEEQLC
jgi:hypothetical protein